MFDRRSFVTGTGLGLAALPGDRTELLRALTRLSRVATARAILTSTCGAKCGSKRSAGTRAAAARLLHCEPDEVAFTHNTTEGFNVLAQGLPLGAGDEVLFSSLNDASASEA